MTSKSFLTAALIVAGTRGAWGQSLVSDGVLGNSGEAGKTLVRFAPGEASGLGVVCDRFGSLWDRAGAGNLNRYAQDGRLLAQYRIPSSSSSPSSQDRITIMGDSIILKLGESLYSLPIEAPAGSEAKKLDIKVLRISTQSRDGWLAAANGPEVFLVRASGEKKPVATLQTPVDAVEIGPDGAVYANIRGTVRKLGEGGDNEPKAVPGDRLQWLDGAWWGHAYHGTIYRYNDLLEPSPGVVLGGASGSFIGHLDQNTELSNGRGLALVRPGIYAVSGWSGILHLLQWQEDVRQFQIVRRVGAVPYCRGLGFDRAGNVWWFSGAWNWTDRPDAPLRYGINPPEGGVVSQAVMLPNDGMLAVGRMYGKPMFFRGRLNKELDTAFVEAELPRDPVAAVSYVDQKNERFLIATNAAGQGRRYKIDVEGRFRSDMGAFTFQTATPVKAWTSLALKDDKTLWGAGDGSIIEMERTGDGWHETSRWNDWGAGETEKLGAQVWISGDAGRLWVADRDNHRVLCFDGATKKLLATYGNTKGDDLGHLDSPQSLAVRGDRAVVFDSGNQRLVKLLFKK